MRSKFRIAVDADYGQGRVLTWREYLLQHALLPGRFAGTPEQIADKVQQYADAGVDGFNVVPVTTLGWWDEWVEHVVPVLQKRGLARKEYRPGTLREKIFGKASQLPATHPQRKLTLE
jgi:alkanesulfonate monooxygenase SsuD/methylene tetrahydromethanopterin reductase-like flavin-dependent oxidoreductase (luciferase family)